MNKFRIMNVMLLLLLVILPLIIASSVDEKSKDDYGDITIQDFKLQTIKAGHTWSFSYRDKAFPGGRGFVYCNFRWKRFDSAWMLVYPRPFDGSDVILKPDYRGCQITIGREGSPMGPESPWYGNEPLGRLKTLGRLVRQPIEYIRGFLDNEYTCYSGRNLIGMSIFLAV
ncbi:hypothetical protein ACFE04_030666 [Oxalis oulophora]